MLGNRRGHGWSRQLPVALEIASVLLAGCGSSVPPPPPSVTVSSQAQSEIDTTTNFGDSITCGVGASSGQYGYASLLDSGIGKPAINYCRSGDRAADMTRVWVYPNSMPTLTGHQLYTVLIGTNDANSCGPSVACIANWYLELEASLTWLALPAGDKIPAQNATTVSGSWNADLGTGLATTALGASLTFDVNQAVAGRTLYIAYRVYDAAKSNPGTATVTLDGAPVGTLSSAPTTGNDVSTGNGTTDTIFVEGVPLGAVGPHALTLSTTSATGGIFALQWVGVSSENYRENFAAPHVVIGSIPTSTSSTLNQTIALYNTQLASMVAALTADGMHITVAPTSTALDIQTDFSDELHPNDDGHDKLAMVFAGVLPN